MVDFGGWDMPVEYPCPGGGLIAEHMAVRTAVGLFDVSHMGEIQFRGRGSLAAVQRITMNDASRLKDGQAHYSALLTPQGGFVDDILVHRLGENDYLLVVNAGTKDKDYAWIRQQVGGFPGIHLADYSSYYSQLALQGPRAQETLEKLTKMDLSAIKNYWFTWGQVAGVNNVLIARIDSRKIEAIEAGNSYIEDVPSELRSSWASGFMRPRATRSSADADAVLDLRAHAAHAQPRARPRSADRRHPRRSPGARRPTSSSCSSPPPIPAPRASASRRCSRSRVSPPGATSTSPSRPSASTPGAPTSRCATRRRSSAG